jgi:flagellar hook-basal body complex protein FliE
MSIQFNPKIHYNSAPTGAGAARPAVQPESAPSFTDKILESLNKVNDQQNQANLSILDLMTGKQQDINTVVAEVAKADMSFKLLVGVRNKLVEAYKETMRMQI